MTGLPDTPTLTVEQTAEILGVSPGALYGSIRRNESPFPVLRVGRRVLVPTAGLRRVLLLDEDGDGCPSR